MNADNENHECPEGLTAFRRTELVLTDGALCRLLGRAVIGGCKSPVSTDAAFGALSMTERATSSAGASTRPVFSRRDLRRRTEHPPSLPRHILLHQSPDHHTEAKA